MIRLGRTRVQQKAMFAKMETRIPLSTKRRLLTKEDYGHKCRDCGTVKTNFYGNATKFSDGQRTGAGTTFGCPFCGNTYHRKKENLRRGK